MTTATTTTADAVRNLIVCDTQFGWAGETTLQLPEILDLQERGWLIEGDENNEFSLTDVGHAVVASALGQGSAAPVMWWDGGERAITAREKALIEEHRPSCFTIPLLPAETVDPTDPWRGLYLPTRMPAPSEYGDLTHPDIPRWPDDREDALDTLVRAQGFDFHIVAGDFTETALEDGDELYWQEMLAWNPEAPEGEWRLAWKGDTEDGPYAWFVRPMALRPEAAGPPAQGIDLGAGVCAIADERRRQVEAEGFSPATDAEYNAGELTKAALAYVQLAAMDLAAGGRDHIATGSPPACWPWHPVWWKPRNARRDLVRAGALIAAQLDVIDSARDQAPEVARG